MHYSKLYKQLCFACLSVAILACSPVKMPPSESQEATAVTPSEQTTHDQAFYDNVMNAAPILPQDLNDERTYCLADGATSNMVSPAQAFSTAAQSKLSLPGWEARVASDWQYFSAPASKGKILVIDTKQQNTNVGYRYLANDNTQNSVYEPWSSSKIFAFTGAVAKVRSEAQNIGANAKIGDTLVSDMITAINSYEINGSAPADSNALATLFANIATRDYLTDLFHQDWLKLDNASVYFRGAYGPSAYTPANYKWLSLANNQYISLKPVINAADDPGYLSYRCDTCGLTGNKAMTTLAQAEWLKRLAMHQQNPEYAHPHLQFEDIQVLFYGQGQSQAKQATGGMMMGISNMLQIALAQAISTDDQGIDTKRAKQILDTATQGKWRVFQKIGWGPSETRSTTENVVLAQVCLPHYQGGRSFTLAAQVALPGASEQNLSSAGQAMQQLLNQSMSELLNHPDTL